MKVGTLFSGIGCPELSLKELGIKHKIVFACDIDLHAKKTYLANHDCQYYYDDVTAMQPPRVDLLMFGFPCQPFSLAGRGRGLSDSRGKIVLNAIDVLKKSKAKHFIAENVEGLLVRDKGKTLNFLLKKFKKLGFNTNYAVLNSLDFGVPQSRRRLWIVGTKTNKNFDFHFHPKKCPDLASVLDRRVDKKVYATKDFLRKEKVITRLQNYSHNYINCITQTICRNGSSSEYISYVAAVYNAIRQKRKPTVKECCRLFGMPSNFVFPDSVCTTRRYAMLANAMVVPVLSAIIGKLFNDR